MTLILSLPLAAALALVLVALSTRAAASRLVPVRIAVRAHPRRPEA